MFKLVCRLVLDLSQKTKRQTYGILRLFDTNLKVEVLCLSTTRVILRSNKRKGDTMEKMKPFSTKINFIRLFADLQVNTTYRLVKQFTKQLEINRSNGAKVLDVGCGAQPYRFLFEKPYMRNVEYIPVDWEGAEENFSYSNNNIVHYDGVHFPFHEEEFDVVFHTEVAEHISDLSYFFKECNRVMKEKGELLFSIPFAARYHYIPYDYWRLTPAGIKLTLENSGFCDIDIRTRGTDITVASYKVISIGYRLLLSKKMTNCNIKLN